MSTATLHNEKIKTHIPKLRFQEFDGEWENEKLLKHVYSISSGKIKPSDEGEFFVYGSTGIIGKSNTYTHEGDYILVARVGANAGQINRAKGKYAVTDNTLIVDLKDNISVSFCESFLTKFNLNKLIFGSGQPLITGGLLKSIDFVFPTLPEQQKIASFLSAVDEKIQQLTRKATLLEQYKKGVMQQLFSGKLRFKDENGEDYPDWKWVGGNELFDNISDKKHNSDLPILAITQDQGAIPRDLINYQMTVTDASVASYKVVQRGDFIISLRTFQGGIEFSEYHGICSPAYNILRPSSEEVDKTFYKLYLKTSYYIKQLQKNLEGIRDGKMISYKYFSEIKLPFPSKPEQQKIANFLSGIDSKIETVNQQLVQTQTFKKGLLQQLFV